jgi:hypothetical protein
MASRTWLHSTGPAKPPSTTVHQIGLPPYRGMGANAALYDVQWLRSVLVSVVRGETALIPALSQFERMMIERGFAAVRSSLADMECFHAKSPMVIHGCGERSGVIILPKQNLYGQGILMRRLRYSGVMSLDGYIAP